MIIANITSTIFAVSAVNFEIPIKPMTRKVKTPKRIGIR